MDFNTNIIHAIDADNGSVFFNSSTFLRVESCRLHSTFSLYLLWAMHVAVTFRTVAILSMQEDLKKTTRQFIFICESLLLFCLDLIFV